MTVPSDVETLARQCSGATPDSGGGPVFRVDCRYRLSRLFASELLAAAVEYWDSGQSPHDAVRSAVEFVLPSLRLERVHGENSVRSELGCSRLAFALFSGRKCVGRILVRAGRRAGVRRVAAAPAAGRPILVSLSNNLRLP